MLISVGLPLQVFTMGKEESENEDKSKKEEKEKKAVDYYGSVGQVVTLSWKIAFIGIAIASGLYVLATSCAKKAEPVNSGIEQRIQRPIQGYDFYTPKVSYVHGYVSESEKRGHRTIFAETRMRVVGEGNSL